MRLSPIARRLAAATSSFSPGFAGVSKDLQAPGDWHTLAREAVAR